MGLFKCSPIDRTHGSGQHVSQAQAENNRIKYREKLDFTHGYRILLFNSLLLEYFLLNTGFDLFFAMLLCSAGVRDPAHSG